MRAQANKIKIALKVDNIVPLNVECAVCGADCSFTIVGKKVDIKLPPCPIAVAEYKNVTKFTVPASDPLPKTTIAGWIQLLDGSGAVMDSLYINAAASK